MLKREDIQIRDPFILPVAQEQKYYLYGTTDKSPWGGIGTGFDVYASSNLEDWEGPFPAFRPEPGFWADRNFWAPEAYFYLGRYYMFASFKAPDRCRGTQVLVSEKPQGPFIPYSDGPVTPADWECLDGTLYVDEEQNPWMVFCHEWLQVRDGEMCAVRLDKDLKEAVGEPVLLFCASEAPWTCPSIGNSDAGQVKNYVTDGPYLYRMQNGKLMMLWSSTGENGYAIGAACSASGKITGPWEHQKEPVFGKNGGHGMLFGTFDGRLLLTLHQPNKTPNERPVFIPVEEMDGRLVLK